MLAALSKRQVWNARRRASRAAAEAVANSAAAGNWHIVQQKGGQHRNKASAEGMRKPVATTPSVAKQNSVTKDRGPTKPMPNTIKSTGRHSPLTKTVLHDFKIGSSSTSRIIMPNRPTPLDNKHMMKAMASTKTWASLPRQGPTLSTPAALPLAQEWPALGA